MTAPQSFPFLLRLAGVEADTDQLSPMESALLAYLVDHRGRPVDQQELLQEVWGYRASVRSRTAYATLHTLRKRLGSAEWITTVRGRGVQLSEAVELVALDQPVRPTRPAVEVPIAREGVLEALARWWQGSARTALVVGPPGVGKSHIVSYFTQTSCPGALWVEDLVEEPATPAAAVAAALGLSTGLDDAAVARALVGHEVELLVFDLPHGALEDTATWLARHAAELPRALVISPLPLRSTIDASVSVPPLSDGGMRQLVRAVSGIDVPADAPLWRHLGGIPLAGILLAPALRSLPVAVVGQRLEDDPLLGGVDDAYARALERGWAGLDASQRDLLGALAMLSHDPDYGCMARLLERPPDAVLTELISVGLVGTTRVEGALRYRIPPAWAALAEHHHASAGWEARLDAWAAEVVDELWSGLWGARHHRVLRRLRELAPTLRTVRSRLPAETAARLVALLGFLRDRLMPEELLAAIASVEEDCRDPEVRLTLARDAADTLRRLRRLPEARARLDAVEPLLTDPHLQGQLHIEHALISLAAFRPADAAVHIERAASGLRPGSLFHRYGRAVAGLVAWYEGETDRARAILQAVRLRLPTDAEGRPILGLVVHTGVLAVLMDLGERVDQQLEDAIAAAVEMRETDNEQTLTLFAARAALERDAFAAAATWLDRSERLLRRLGRDPARSLIPVLRGLSALFQGNPSGAVEPLLVASECGDPYIEIWGRGLLVLAARDARLSVEDLVDVPLDAVVSQALAQHRAKVLGMVLQVHLGQPVDRAALLAEAERTSTGRLLCRLLPGGG